MRLAVRPQIERRQAASRELLAPVRLGHASLGLDQFRQIIKALVQPAKRGLKPKTVFQTVVLAKPRVKEQPRANQQKTLPVSLGRLASNHLIEHFLGPKRRAHFRY